MADGHTLHPFYLAKAIAAYGTVCPVCHALPHQTCRNYGPCFYEDDPTDEDEYDSPGDTGEDSPPW